MVRLFSFILFAVMLSILLVTSTGYSFSVSGCVYKSENEVFAGCDVWLVHAVKGVFHNVSNESGEFLFRELPFGEVSLIVRGPEFAVDGLSFLLTKDENIRVILKRGIIQKIKIYAPNLSPLPGAEIKRIWINDKFCIPFDEVADKGYGRLRSNDDGEIEVNNFPSEGFFRVLVSHIDFADTYLPYLPISQSKFASVIMSSGFIVRGRVTKDSKPVANASIIALQKGTGYQIYTVPVKTDSDGLYRLRLPAGEYKLFASHPSFPNTQPQEISISEDTDEQLLNFEFREPLHIVGKVLLPDGTPSKLTKVILREPSGMEDFAFTDENGEYRLKANMAKVIVKILPPPGYMTESLPEINVDFKELKEVRAPVMKLKKLPIIEGIVKYSDGEVAERVFIRSKNLELPIFAITDEIGKFNIALGIFPDVEKVDFVAEHALRFLRSDFSVNLFELQHPNEIVLRPFEPTQDKFVNPLCQNQLGHLIDKPIPKIICRTWFNYTPHGDVNEDLKGKVVLILFWGGFDNTLNGIAHLEEMRALFDLYKGISDVQVFSIHDGASVDKDVEEYVKNYQVKFPVGIDNESAETFNNFSIKNIPQFILVDKSGILRYTDIVGRTIELIKVLRRAG